MALSAVPAVGGHGQIPSTYPKAKLVDHEGRPVRASELVPGQTYLFHYPYRAIPCFLLRLPATQVAAAGEDPPASWPGGVGPDRAVVAYLAICTHLLTHPTPKLAMIHYYPPDAPSDLAERGGVITCCAHGSVFDPAAGARVVAGPAPAPLPAIELRHDERDDTLTAVAIHGAFDFGHYLTVFKRELRRTYGHRLYRTEVGAFTEVLPLEAFAIETVSC